MKQHPILHMVSKFMLPFIILFGLYVQFHGDFGPGGGFQAGVIVAVGFILYGLIYGSRAIARVIAPFWLRFYAAIGVLLYGGVGVVSQLKGARFLDYNVLASSPVGGQHLGILLVELGVGLTVASVLIFIFLLFAERRHQ